MGPPIGFVTLYNAVDAVGRALAGSSWQYASPLNREADKDCDDTYERVITMIAEGCEAGQIAAGYRTVTGGVDNLDPAVWLSPVWCNYFVTGTIDIDLPLVDERLQPVTDGRTARCTREIFVRRESLDRFILNVAPDVASSCDGIAPKRPSRGPKAGIKNRVMEAMRRDLKAGKTTNELLQKEPEKALAETYGASRDTIRKARKMVLVETQSKPKIKSSANDK